MYIKCDLLTVICTGFERCILKSFAEVKHEIRELRQSQALLKAKVDHLPRFTGAAQQQGDPLPEDIQFPLSSVEELGVLEAKLKDSQQKQLMVSMLVNVNLVICCNDIFGLDILCL